MADEQPGWTLYRLAGLGLLNVPQTGNVSALSLLLDAALIHQMLLVASADGFRPGLAVPAAALRQVQLAGRTVLRAARAKAQRFVSGGAPKPDERAGPSDVRGRTAGFGLLALPRALHGLLLAMGAASLVLLGTEAQLSRMLGVLFYATFTETYQILGAAVAVGALSLRSPDKKILYGIGVAAVYVLAPVVLFFIGLLDRAMRFRARFVRHADHHKEE